MGAWGFLSPQNCEILAAKFPRNTGIRTPSGNDVAMSVTLLASSTIGVGIPRDGGIRFSIKPSVPSCYIVKGNSFLPVNSNMGPNIVFLNARSDSTHLLLINRCLFN